MRRLILFRHAKADRPEGIGDQDRPLARRGRRQAGRMGKYLASAGYRPDLVLVSPSRRTRDTWNLAEAAFPDDIRASEDARLYAATSETILDVLKETPSRVRTLAVVGHNPGLQELALALIGQAGGSAREKLAAKFPAGAIATIDFDCDEWSRVSMGSGRLKTFATPKSVAE